MRYLFGLLITIGLLILLIILIISRGNAKHAPSTAPKPLSSYSTTDVEARLIVGGPITSQQTHQQIEITVGQDEVTYVQINGYNGQIANSQSYPNTQNSYYNFLRALEVANFTLGNHDKNLANNTGYCPLSNRYNYQLVEGSTLLQNLWSTSCGTRTYNGNASLTQQLFKNQVPNFDTLAQNLTIVF